MACAFTGQASFIQQHSSMLWIRKSLNAPPLSHRNEWNRLICQISSLGSLAGLRVENSVAVGPAMRYARIIVRSPIAPSLIRSNISPRARQWRHISPTPTFWFFLTDSLASSNILTEVGASTDTGFSMNTLSPLSMAYLKWTQRNTGGVAKNHDVARLQAVHRFLVAVEADEPAVLRHVDLLPESAAEVAA